MSVGEKLITADELFKMGTEVRTELVKGVLREMNPTGWSHGNIASEIHLKLGPFVRDHGLGQTVIAEAGFRIESNPDTVRAPDVAFVCADRVPTGFHGKFFEGAPDLAVEVVSPTDRLTDVMEKVELWLRCGTQTVWLVDPIRKSASVFKVADGQVQSCNVEVLVDQDLLPGFELPVSELWD
jgi:Uma2 family endonuclease